jgi:uncharacterized protein (AIM24 family)
MLAYQNCAMATHFAAGSLWEKLKSYALGGELLWRNSFTAQKGGGWIALEEQMPGQIVMQDLSPDRPALMIRGGAYLASNDNVQFETRYLGLSGYFAGKGTAVQRAFVEEGTGKVFFHADGCTVRALPVRPEDGPLIVDNDMILAYSENLACELKNPGSSTSSFLFSGEGMVCEFSGDGIVYVASGTQTGRSNFLGATAMKAGAYAAAAIGVVGVAAAACYGFQAVTGKTPLRFLAERFLPSWASRFV